MSHRGPLLMSAENPGGWKLEDILEQLGVELTAKTERLSWDTRKPAQDVAANNRVIMRHLRDARGRQLDSLKVLEALGPDQGPTGTPRVGPGSEGGPASR